MRSSPKTFLLMGRVVKCFETKKQENNDMPWTKKQQITAAIAMHHPAKLKKKNKGMLGMTHSQLQEMATNAYKSDVRKRRKK